MKDTTDNKPVSLFFDFIYNNNDNNDHLLCGIIEDLWASQDDDVNVIKKNTTTKTKTNEELVELQAYLYEIDMNLEYFRNDYKQFNDYDLDINIDKLLSFSSTQDACNMLLYETEISCKLRFGNSSNKAVQLAEIFAHVDAIPEFVPNFQTDMFDSELDERMLFEDAAFYDEFLTDENAGDIFENVYNYVEGDEEEEEITTTSDDSGTNCNPKFMAAFLLRKKLAALDIDNSSSSSAASSLNAGSKFGIPRMIKNSSKDAFRKPCVYMLNEGRCMRSDCRFAHDLHNITCKYWLEGECLKGDCCEFLHEFVTTSGNSSVTNPLSIPNSKGELTAAALKARQKAKDFSLNNLDFPDLSTASVTSNKSAVVVGKGSTTNEVCDDNNNNIETTVDVDSGCSKLNIEDHNLKIVNKKSRKFKDNILYSMSLPAFQLTNRKKNIN
jgi:hypothetical protein